MQQGRPDEQRAGRAILKDFINGKLLHCVGPDGYTGEMGVLGDAIKVAMDASEHGERANHRLVGDDGVFNDGVFEDATTTTTTRTMTMTRTRTMTWTPPRTIPSPRSSWRR